MPKLKRVFVDPDEEFPSIKGDSKLLVAALCLFLVWLRREVRSGSNHGRILNRVRSFTGLDLDLGPNGYQGGRDHIKKIMKALDLRGNSKQLPYVRRRFYA